MDLRATTATTNHWRQGINGGRCIVGYCWRGNGGFMKKYTLAFFVNDQDKFQKDVMKPALDSMRASCDGGDYGCFAVSASDEFRRLEKIESTLENQEMSDSEKLDEIMEIFGSINP